MSQTARTAETMLAELVHHMAELVKTQSETNRLLQELIRLGRK
jgi:hypothetical protein